CPLLATKIRLPSGEQTTFHGSAPVVISPLGPTLVSTAAENVPQAGSLTLMRVTELPEALATYTYWLSGVSARLCGSVPTAIFASRTLVSGRITLTELSAGFTTQIRWSLKLIAIGLE